MPGIASVYALRLTYARRKGCKFIPGKCDAIRRIDDLIKLQGKLVLVHTYFGVGTNPIIRHPRQIGQRFLRDHCLRDCTEPCGINDVELPVKAEGVSHESARRPGTSGRRVKNLT